MNPTYFEECPNIAREYRINHLIRAREVRLIGSGTDGEEGADAVVLETREALELAREQGLDLVEVSPNQNPPVVKLLDYGRFKFVQSKKAKEAKKHQVKNVQREVRMRPKIGQHDIDSKIRKVKQLLNEGAKVKVTVMLRGRENQHPEIAVKVLRRVAESVTEEAKLEQAPKVEQRSLSIVLAPATGQPVGASSSGASASDQSG